MRLALRTVGIHATGGGWHTVATLVTGPGHLSVLATTRVLLNDGADPAWLGPVGRLIVRDSLARSAARYGRRC